MDQVLVADREDLMASFRDVVNDASVENTDRLLDAFGVTSNSMVDTMQSIQKNMSNFEDAIQRQLNTVLELLATKSGRRIQTGKPFYIDSEDVDCSFESSTMIGEGSYGRVFKGTWASRSIAIKRSIAPLHAQESAKEIEREAEKWYPLRHPNVVPLFGLCINADFPFLVMPYMKNGNVFAYLKKHPGTSQAVRTGWCFDVAQAMAYLVKSKITHGDIKVRFYREC
ncbi:hypothetical protein HDU91_002512 [Kappamyces sp. JEL0680]|nr:hypothetical protein HDU91_002512 [Kappamyces sp. JEL0680]